MSCPPFLRAGATHLHLGSSSAPHFINGVSYAWRSFGHDFDSSDAFGFGGPSYCSVEDAMRWVAQNGGNTLRLALFEQPEALLELDTVVDPLTLRSSTLVRGVKPGVLSMAAAFLELAEHYDLHLIFALFRGRASTAAACGLLEGEGLASLVERALTPLAAALSDHSRLALWEVISEPEGLLDIHHALHERSGGGCTDAWGAVTYCNGIGHPAGWNAYLADDPFYADASDRRHSHVDPYVGVTGDDGTTPSDDDGCVFPVRTLQAFVNRAAAALHAASPRHLVSVGAWTHCTSTSGPPASHAQNLWRDECLVAAGGEAGGTLDLYSIGTAPRELSGRCAARRGLTCADGRSGCSALLLTRAPAPPSSPPAIAAPLRPSSRSRRTPSSTTFRSRSSWATPLRVGSASTSTAEAARVSRSIIRRRQVPRRRLWPTTLRTAATSTRWRRRIASAWRSCTARRRSAATPASSGGASTATR